MVPLSARTTSRGRRNGGGSTVIGPPELISNARNGRRASSKKEVNRGKGLGKFLTDSWKVFCYKLLSLIELKTDQGDVLVVFRRLGEGGCIWS
ncbi:hypothetical protein GWI33_014855 [Rhynchophorus ferrugineus]|uniref:Uncharacterized protein n=1 Tax=Rhynchophorus ferrugineus TaxID=354439 RepID=A0A834MBY8_RHYFE|nr:hypothetical protein GWI33_014855 [Rhynchophorus ferrugineus]